MIAVGLSAGVLTTVGWLLIDRSLRRAAPPSEPSASAIAAAELVSDDRQVFQGYVPSSSCKACHEEAYAAWQSSNHAHAERLPQTALDAAAFEPSRTFQHASQQTEVGQFQQQYRVKTLGPSNRVESFGVERVIGHDPLRQFLVKFSGGRYQVLEASYDPKRDEWFNVYGAEDRQPGEWGHWTGRGMNWNNMCAACHNTRVRKNFDESSDTYRTAMAETSVGCGACHGPMKAHHDWQNAQGTSGQKDPTVSKLTPQQTLDNCAYCHARRGELTGDFKPGDHFLDQARLTIVDYSEIYYADGQIREEDYEFAAFLGSRMHYRGVKCVDCHNFHSGKTLLPGNWLCMRCHGGSMTAAPVINPVAHSRHKVFGYDAAGVPAKPDLAAYKPTEIKETGGECVNCHMPRTLYMQRHWRHDHGFTTPDPLLTKQHGVPNACNRCHQDKDADWALRYCDEWFGSKMDRPSRRRAQTIAAARQGVSSARDGLLELIAREEIPYWRAVAGGLLERWATEPAVGKALLQGVDHADALVRESCVRSLQPCLDANPRHVEKQIRARLDDPMRNVRMAAAWALASSIDPGSRAGRELLDSLDINADQPVGQLQKVAYALAHNDSLQALVHYQRALEWDPNSALICHDYAVLLSGLNRHDEAVRKLETACKLEPNNADYRYKLALAWNELGNLSKTIEELRTAVRLDEQHARAWYNLGLALNSVGQTSEGLAALSRAELAAPNDPRIPYARATILLGIRRTSEARDAARRALQIEPRYGPAVELLRASPE